MWNSFNKIGFEQCGLSEQYSGHPQANKVHEKVGLHAVSDAAKSNISSTNTRADSKSLQQLNQGEGGGEVELSKDIYPLMEQLRI